MLLPTETEVDREGGYSYIWCYNSPSGSKETVTRGSTLFV